ncbi:ATP-binding protein [Micromonospora sp. BRA006-A]|nr:ATP-binding protein [Micromonospora sp. BRA006-A]
MSRAVGKQRAYEQERARAAELAALDRAKTNFFANVSHEFRTPLTLVLGPMEEMLADRELPERYLDRLTVMHRNGLRLLKLVNTVLDFSPVGVRPAGRPLPAHRPVRLHLPAGQHVPLGHRAGRAAPGGGLPAAAAPVYVDRDMWEKIVLNLVSNAVKFTFDGEIRVRVRATDGAAVLEVTDTGVGIAPEELPQVFERFHRVAGARSRTHEGTGIGLALVRELVEMHGGTVTAHSVVDRGTTFAVTMPFGYAHLPADRVAALSPVPLTEPEQAACTSPRRRSGPTRWPAPPGCRSRPARPAGPAASCSPTTTPTCASTSPGCSPRRTRWSPCRTAWRRAAGRRDPVRPGADRCDDAPAGRLRAGRRCAAEPATRHVPIVLLSARAGAAEEVAGLSTGADDYLTKPFSSQELVARVRANVELGQLRGQIIRRLRASPTPPWRSTPPGPPPRWCGYCGWAARHALRLAEAGRVRVTATGARHEEDAGGDLPVEPTVVLPLTGTAGEQLGELRVWRREGGGTEEAALAQLAG